MLRKASLIAAAVALTFSASAVWAKVSQQEADTLGKTLTPLGGEVAGNADGSIPAYTGGITTPPENYSPGDHHPDPFPEDKVLFEITGENYQQYSEFLSEGQKKLFEMYSDTYRMPVYQTRRSASNPQFVYDATKANATRAELIESGNGIKGAATGIPFPIPQNGLEAIWNHILRYRGEAVQRFGGQAAVTSSGNYTRIGFDEKLLIKYSNENAKPEDLEEENILFFFKQKITEPARLAGDILLVKETVDQVKEPREAWKYNTGRKRLNRVPQIAYDTPGTESDGLRTTDDFDMYNGSPDRYDWTLKGKKEMYVAYNSYALHSDEISYDDILKPNHINPDLTRWEKHRVWVVEANLKEGLRHIYQKRVFFIDEDSWQIQEADMYDKNDELYRVAFAYGINYYDVPTQWSTLDVYHDLNSRRYLAIGLDNEEKMYDFTIRPREREFTSQALRREGR
ncbi:DUF1329 domain-containing protein [Alteromonas sp. 14N.309.X.WAT.G.H12]|uniref:DUF1329 domain-containing protein n=1 Tax=Alteromonas sp. 14N.309.X.WAT.G.H12 TaxID=3120824 RepID=UPI002FD6C42D